MLKPLMIVWILLFALTAPANEKQVWNTPRLVVSADLIVVGELEGNEGPQDGLKEVISGADVKVLNVLLGSKKGKTIHLEDDGASLGMQPGTTYILFLKKDHGGYRLLTGSPKTAILANDKNRIKKIQRYISRMDAGQRTLSVVLEAPKTTFKRGEDIFVYLMLSHGGAPHDGFWINERLRIGDPHAPVKEVYFQIMTPMGTIARFKGEANDPETTKENFWYLPGHSRYFRKFHLSKHFDFSEPGIYRVQAFYVNAETGNKWKLWAWYGKKASNEVTLIID